MEITKFVIRTNLLRAIVLELYIYIGNLTLSQRKKIKFKTIFL